MRMESRAADIVVRQAEPDDAEALAEIIVSSWRAAYADILPLDALAGSFMSTAFRRRMFERRLVEPGGTRIFIGLGGGKPCGLSFVDASNADGLPRCGELHCLYLLPERWGSGLAAKLMDASLAFLCESGCERVLLWVLEENRRARAFYEKHGFVPDGEVKASGLPGAPLERRYAKRL